ncbi:uncharacterized protein [Onthophagus taurus]|uniref:uncharacterized protein isoform X1 n=1 Tax=Onthophagus taurus TaxID=166361 RepID=UPI000C208455|nr:uncharacterized protein LOC111414075 isoform X1 [Onthophagus taurus]
MGRCGPVFLAFLLSCFGINIFIKERSGCEPLISSLIFLTSIMVVLWQLRLYPASFRKLSIHFLYVVEFFFSAFLMEHLMVHFWTPLEERMTEFLPKISDFEDEILKQGGWACGGLFTFLRWDETLVGASYLLSLFFLFGALHGIRALDFRLIRYGGVSVFLTDVCDRAYKLKRRIMKMFFTKRKCPNYRRIPRNTLAYQSGNNGISLDDSDDDFCPDEDEDYEFNNKFSKKFS